MSEEQKEEIQGKVRQKGAKSSRVVKWAAVTLTICAVLALTLILILQNPRDFYWFDRQFSLTMQPLTPGDPFSDKGMWVETGWDDMNGGHRQMHGLKFGNRLIRLDVVYDPIRAIKKRLPTTVPKLLPLLASKDPLEKHCVGEALIQIGPAAHSAYPLLLKRYQEGDEVMEWIILDLAKVAGTGAVSHLSSALTNTSPKVRQKAAEALGEMGTTATNSLPQLRGALGDPDPAVTVASALALRKIDKHEHGEVSALMRLLTNQDQQVRLAAVFALGEYGAEAAPSLQLLLPMLENSRPEEAGLMARTLGLIGSPATPAIPRLISLLDNKNQQTLMFVMDALGRFGEDAQAAIPKLLKLAEEPEPMWGAISALSSMGSNAVPGLLHLYCNGTIGQYSWVARAFQKQGPKAGAAVPTLVADLRSENSGRIETAAWVLGYIGKSAKVAIPDLMQLIEDNDPHVRIRVAEALWKLDHQTNAVLPVMVAELADWAKEPDCLLHQTSDEHDQSRQQIAAEVLGDIGPAAKEAVPLLQLMVRSSFEEQKKAAGTALQRILP